MQVFNFLALIVSAAALAYFAFHRALIYLHILQQDEYNPERLILWIKQNSAFDKRGSTVCLSVIVAAVIFGGKIFFAFAGAVALSLLAFIQTDPRRLAKVPLKMTTRANKTFTVFCVFFLLIILLAINILKNYPAIYFYLAAIIIIQSIPLLLSLAVKILKPLEESLQKKYLLEASEKFKASAPFTIAVTGSFGKTSVKNYLGETLQSLSGATFWPSGGTNTLMGITREIRENLNPWHKNAVIEIGAYRPGSIAKVCKELTPPDISIITAINVAHLERFGSLDVTYQAKTEIALALSDKGILITNGDDQLALKAGLEIKKAKNIIYGFSDIPQINCRGSNLKYAKEGTTFTITFEGKSYDIKTKLLGKTAASNLLAVFAAAVCCGVNLDLLPAALSNISPVSNRLTLNKRGSYNFLDDAYNSNEIGFKSALEVMQQIEAPEKIIITPGVIELGDKQFEVNKHLGEIASKVADKIIVVSKTNREAFKAGIEDSRLIIADSREEAFAKLNEIAKPEALVLLENDLTDLHEHEYKF